MAEIKTVGIKALKDNLSSYLPEVRSGVLILVTDRGSVVAEIKKPEVESLARGETSLARDWIDRGWLVPARNSKGACRRSGLDAKEGTGASLLDRDRGE